MTLSDQSLVKFLLARASYLPPEALDLALIRATKYAPNSIRAEVRDILRAKEESPEKWSSKQRERLERTLRRTANLKQLATSRDPTTVEVLSKHVYPHVRQGRTTDFDSWLTQRYPIAGAPLSLLHDWLKQLGDTRYTFLVERLAKQLPDPLPPPSNPTPYLNAVERLAYTHRRGSFIHLQEFLFWAHRAGHGPLAPLAVSNPYGRDIDPQWLWDLDEWHRSFEGRPLLQYSYYTLREDLAAALTRAGGYEDPRVLLKATMTLPGKNDRTPLPKGHCAKLAGALQLFVTWHAKLDAPYSLDTAVGSPKPETPHPCLANEPVSVELTMGELAEFREKLIAALKELSESQGGALELYSASSEQRPTAAFLALCSTWWGHKMSPLFPARGLQLPPSE